nr:hypothetical protein [Tanacetum cinerariifolium]
MALHTRIVAYSGQTRFDLTFISNSWRHPWDPTLGIAFRKMSTMANTTPIVTTVTKPATNPEREKTPRDADATPRINILDFCKEYSRTSCQPLWTRFALTSEKKSMLGNGYDKNETKSEQNRTKSRANGKRESPESSPTKSKPRNHQRFPAQSVGSSSTKVLDLPCLLVLITETSQSRQHDPSSSGRIIGLIPNHNQLMTSSTS